MKKRRNKLLTLVIPAFSFAVLAVVHMRLETTILGYDIGRLKADEEHLLKEKNQLTVELAKLNERDRLLQIIGANEPKSGGLAKR